MSETIKTSSSVVAEILARIPNVLTEEAPRDLNEFDYERLDRESRVKRIGKTVADILEGVGVEIESRTKPTANTAGKVEIEKVDGWTVLDPEDIGVNEGVFLSRKGTVYRLWHTRYESWDSTFMYDCLEGSAEALGVLESEQFQHGVAKLIANLQQTSEAPVADVEYSA